VQKSRDISNAVLFLASDEVRYVTGLDLIVDAGKTIRKRTFTEREIRRLWPTHRASQLL
jgi:enoyl-ACP reductase-like protein